MSERIAAVAERLRTAGVPFALVGAGAMSTRGFPRQTLDLDLLTTDARVLGSHLWEGLSPPPELRRGDADDPLAGVVRFHDPEIDVIVGRHAWQAEVVSRAEPLTVGELVLPVATVGDLVLLKLDAGGYRDAADVRTMLAGVGEEVLLHVEAALDRLPAEARRLWKDLLAADR